MSTNYLEIDERSIAAFKHTPVIGNRVDVEIIEKESTLFDSLIDSDSAPSRNRQKAIITIGDVDRSDTQTVQMDTDSLEKIAEWYLNVVEMGVDN